MRLALLLRVVDRHLLRQRGSRTRSAHTRVSSQVQVGFSMLFRHLSSLRQLQIGQRCGLRTMFRHTRKVCVNLPQMVIRFVRLFCGALCPLFDIPHCLHFHPQLEQVIGRWYDSVGTITCAAARGTEVRRVVLQTAIRPHIPHDVRDVTPQQRRRGAVRSVVASRRHRAARLVIERRRTGVITRSCQEFQSHFLLSRVNYFKTTSSFTKKDLA